jgi:hypothetical protein
MSCAEEVPPALELPLASASLVLAQIDKYARKHLLFRRLLSLARTGSGIMISASPSTASSSSSVDDHQTDPVEDTASAFDESKATELTALALLPQEYLRFHALRRAHPQLFLSPPPLIDEAWHAHILCTHAYAHFCDTQFAGVFQHHDPGKFGFYFNTRRVYCSTFGEPNNVLLWPPAREALA